MNATVSSETKIGASRAEMERRHEALREAMQADELEAIIVCGRGHQRHRGRIFYISEIFQMVASEGFFVFPLDGEPAFVTIPVASLGEAWRSPWVQDQRITYAPGTELAQVLDDRGLSSASIGIVGLGDCLSYVDHERMRTRLPQATFTDATELYDRVRQVKSPEEIANLRETSTIGRAIFTALQDEMVPGRSEREIAAQGHRILRELGCRDGGVSIQTTPFRSRPRGTDRPLAKEDVISVGIEVAGPSGYWLEAKRHFSFGPPPEPALQFWQMHQEAFDAAAGAMRPGGQAGTILDATREVYEKHGYTTHTMDAPGTKEDLGTLCSAHGIGTDAVEGVWIPGPDRPLMESEVMCIHPWVRITEPEAIASLSSIKPSDSVLLTASGAERLTFPDDEWVEL